ncbi:hypothetical protein HG421_19080 [Xanthomonas campestris pv. badrii]|uniref:Uncharacterized protein n=1 Tax=Xanthomonas campestris pv. badrii TaxID=149696 RepID=A0A7Z2VDE2_XANCA|nr:hypothetical protein [Xanthomonas campestris]QJD69591.1 hypothetical protein HG421_19080 [Xanthomonas campestris pv. badrii]
MAVSVNGPLSRWHEGIRRAREAREASVASKTAASSRQHSRCRVTVADGAWCEAATARRGSATHVQDQIRPTSRAPPGGRADSAACLGAMPDDHTTAARNIPTSKRSACQAITHRAVDRMSRAAHPRNGAPASGPGLICCLAVALVGCMLLMLAPWKQREMSALIGLHAQPHAPGCAARASEATATAAAVTVGKNDAADESSLPNWRQLTRALQAWLHADCH